MGWQEEKEKNLKMSLEERRKHYWCEEEYFPLENLNTWSTDEMYYSKLNVDKNKMDEDEKKIESQLLKDLDINTNIDLSNKVSLYEGDITKLEVDAIVNAANNSLLGGGGVDGAIHRAAGELLLKENKTLGGCPDGEARISGGYNLPAKYVISTVGPRGERKEVLESAYRNCLQTAVDNEIKSIAFPCISTGVFGYPNDKACCVALRAVRMFLESNHEKLDRVVFCLFLPVDIKLYKQRMPIMFPSQQEDTPSVVEGESSSKSPDAAAGGVDEVKPE